MNPKVEIQLQVSWLQNVVGGDLLLSFPASNSKDTVSSHARIPARKNLEVRMLCLTWTQECNSRNCKVDHLVERIIVPNSQPLLCFLDFSFPFLKKNSEQALGLCSKIRPPCSSSSTSLCFRVL
ncbi:hypothetical protein M758_8G138600 [Ceratodon purpureus]|nr:hypothetical protein M758_8G138600 [Ceratodon purpureus]